MNAFDLIRSAAANTVRSKLRTTLTVLALFVGAFTLTLTTALGAGVSDYVTKQVASLGASDVFLIAKASSTTATGDGPIKYDPAKSAASNGTSNPLTGSAGSLTQADIGALRAIVGLTRVDPISPVSIDWVKTATSDKYELTIAPTSSIAQVDLLAGKQLDPASSSPQLTLPIRYLSALGLPNAPSAVGTRVTLGFTDILGGSRQAEATVVGISNTSLLNSGVGGNAALVNGIAAQQKAGSAAREQYQVAVARFDPRSTPEQIAALKSQISGAGMTAQTIADQLGLIQTVITGITGVLNAFAIVALLAAAFGIVNTLLMSVQERTREIGLMKAMGMSNGRVFVLFSFEAAFIGLLGSALGVLAAMLVGLPLNGALAAGPLSGLAGLQLLLFQPAAVAGVMLLIVLLAFLSGTLPARRAARKTPIDALRYE